MYLEIFGLLESLIIAVFHFAIFMIYLNRNIDMNIRSLIGFSEIAEYSIYLLVIVHLFDISYQILIKIITLDKNQYTKVLAPKKVEEVIVEEDVPEEVIIEEEEEKEPEIVDVGYELVIRRQKEIERKKKMIMELSSMGSTVQGDVGSGYNESGSNFLIDAISKKNEDEGKEHSFLKGKKKAMKGIKD